MAPALEIGLDINKLSVAFPLSPYLIIEHLMIEHLKITYKRINNYNHDSLILADFTDFQIFCWFFCRSKNWKLPSFLIFSLAIIPTPSIIYRINVPWKVWSAIYSAECYLFRVKFSSVRRQVKESFGVFGVLSQIFNRIRLIAYW